MATLSTRINHETTIACIIISWIILINLPKQPSKRPSNHLSANPKKWLNTVQKFVGNSLMTCCIVFDHFVGLALKGLRYIKFIFRMYHSPRQPATSPLKGNSKFEILLLKVFSLK